MLLELNRAEECNNCKRAMQIVIKSGPRVIIMASSQRN